MTASIQTRDTAAVLLANREDLSLKKATTYLVSRMRVRTPLGAAEFLTMSRTVGRAAYKERVELALALEDLYREIFRIEHRATQSPPFSTQREHEFFRLVNARLFPIDVSMLDEEPLFFWPGIPLTGTQQHDWIEGCCPFQTLQTVFKLGLVLSGQAPGRWKALNILREPAPPLEAVGWTLFVYACAVEESPLRMMPMVFNMLSYKTNNPWLDIPPGMSMYLDWTPENVARLCVARQQADRINTRVLELERWLLEDPTARIGRVVEIWNTAAMMERQGL